MKFFVQKHDHSTPIKLVYAKNFEKWLGARPKGLHQKLINTGFSAQAKSVYLDFALSGHLKQIFIGIEDKFSLYDAANLVDVLKSRLSQDGLKNFAFNVTGLRKQHDLNVFYLGWAMACYDFSLKTNAKEIELPKLLTANADAHTYAINLYTGIKACRDLVNIPANILGPQALEEKVKELSSATKPKIKVIRDEDLLKQNFHMIHAVGRASPDRPRLMVLEWGKPSLPSVSLVGKGVTFDTGGLNIKPGRWMDLMKKDMGGAAHAFGLSLALVMAKLPIHLKLYLPIVENAVAGNAFRPSDVLKSRKGITVEVQDTDAEGRLIVADALAYASEDKPELLVDFTTLTGSARVALGYDLAPYFCNNPKLAKTLRDVSVEAEDEMWELPLWKPYFRHIKGEISDIKSLGMSGRAGATHAALFLQEFIDKSIDWVHFDIYGWSQADRPGHKKGGTDQSLRTMYHYLEKRYGK